MDTLALFKRFSFHTEKPFIPVHLTQADELVSTLAFGFTLGFGWFACMHAWRQTHRLTVYTVLIWAELIVCLVFSIICWLYLNGVIIHSFAFYFSILTTWALQVQFLLQIIVNRICLLERDAKRRFWLKAGIAIFITCINISVYCIWVPAKLQITERYHVINLYWDRCEKVIYLFTDALLNFIFVRTVKQRLVSVGLTKYDRLVAFNLRIIFVSLACDCLIIGMMSYPNDFVYMQFHPVAYIIKLEIEMTMSFLIVKVARGTGVNVIHELPKAGSGGRDHGDLTSRGGHVDVHVLTEVVTHKDDGMEDPDDDMVDSDLWSYKRDTKVMPTDREDNSNQLDIKTDDIVLSSRTSSTGVSSNTTGSSSPGTYVHPRSTAQVVRFGDDLIQHHVPHTP